MKHIVKTYPYGLLLTYDLKQPDWIDNLTLLRKKFKSNSAKQLAKKLNTQFERHKVTGQIVLSQPDGIAKADYVC